MILATVTKLKDGSFIVNRWKKDAVVNVLTKKRNLIKTHEATCVECPSAEQIKLFYGTPPDSLRKT